MSRTASLTFVRTDSSTAFVNVASFRFKCALTAPSDARHWAADLLERALPDMDAASQLVSDAVLCVSELVTNAVSAGCSQVTLRIDADPDEVHLALLDDAPGVPRLTRAALDAWSGRGLAIIQAIAAGWGFRDAPAGKEVWVRLKVAV